METVVRNRYSKRIEVIAPKSVGKTQQQFKQSSDINFILEKYRKTGLLPAETGVVQQMFGDFSDIPDYQTSLNLIKNAEIAFSMLDSKTRKRFNNDPAELIAFCEDRKNYKEAQDLGLIEKKEIDDNNMPNGVNNQAQGEKTVSKDAVKA